MLYVNTGVDRTRYIQVTPSFINSLILCATDSKNEPWNKYVDSNILYTESTPTSSA